MSDSVLKDNEHQRRKDIFSFEAPDAQHSPGSHWGPFMEDVEELRNRLPRIMPQALVVDGFSDLHDLAPPPFEPPPYFPNGVCLSWPRRDLGIMAVLRSDKMGRSMEALFPFSGNGSEHTLSLHHVYVWPSGVEAQIVASMADGSLVTFFDSLYIRNREWYAKDETYQFQLCGIAYDAAEAEDQTLRIKHEPEILAALKQSAQEHGYAAPDEVEEIHTKGLAAFMPMPELDRDDYNFHGVVKRVKEIEMLDQPGWMVRTTVMRRMDDSRDIDLDILITRRAWEGEYPPEAGRDIEGVLWLQGQLWYPHRWQVPDYET